MRTRRHAVNGLLTLLIYGIFALFSLFLVVIGARVYRNIVAAGRENTQLRSSFSYVANKVRMSTRAAGSVRLEEQEGMEVLVLESGTEGYETRIYYYDGALREAYQASDRPLDPKLGEKLMELSEFRIEETDTGHLVLSAADEGGNRRSLHLYLEGKSL
ncbi:MAG: DUF4860 domain-containing protein [Lachnospiraceae bacterium]|jgi:hypothetical protein|nr:DUF4860 domain-containing protein [Lachnospiraceae bacterium]